MNLAVYEWARKWCISPEALQDLVEIIGVHEVPPATPGQSEAAVSSRVRLKASQIGVRLWRNNVGAAYTEDGRLIRYGLGNESAQLNKRIKSSDLIGITPHKVTERDIGVTLGIFTSYETKRENWKFKGATREIAQLNWIQAVGALGGIAKFITSEDQI